jgi:hypothetical protein
MNALFFSADSGGVSGSSLHFALLQPGSADSPAISNAQIFVTADFVWGGGEAHHQEHRYFIGYVLKSFPDLDRPYYFLDDRYMTVRKYDLERADILAAEKPEIIARLRRVKAAAHNNPATQPPPGYVPIVNIPPAP